MRLNRCTRPEVEAHLAKGGAVLLPMGPTEQHRPMRLIGTDTLCATAIAEAAAPFCGAVVAPSLGYAPAPFNTGFPGTISILEPARVLSKFLRQGFSRVYLLNGQGANLAPLRRAKEGPPPGAVRLRSRWDFDTINTLRQTLYGDWEGMHSTPSEIATTMATAPLCPASSARPAPQAGCRLHALPCGRPPRPSR